MTSLAVAVVLGLPMFVDDTVDEQVVAGTPASEAARGGSDHSKPEGSAAAGNVEVARGSFEPLAHPGSGTANVVELADGGQRLTLTDFETDNGPDLFVYLAAGNPTGDDLGEFEDLGRLKGNKGDQQYVIPDGVDVKKYSTVVIWCRAFTVAFTKAPLERS